MTTTSHDRAVELADRFFQTWDTDGDRDRVIERIAWMREQGVGDHTITNAAKSVQGKKHPVSLFMEVTSSEARWMAAALAGSQIYPAPGIAPPKQPLADDERPHSWPTMCKVHGTRLHTRNGEDLPTRCLRCEAEGDYPRRTDRTPRPPRPGWA